MIASHSPAPDDAPGAHLTRVVLSIGTLDLLRLVEYEHAFPRHSHEEFTIGVFETGNGSLGYRRGRWRAYDGSILAVPPDEVHTAEPLPASGWSYRAMYPSAALVATALDQPGVRDVPAFFGQPILDDSAVAAVIGRVHRRLFDGFATIEEETLLLWSLRELIARHGVVLERARPTTSGGRAVELARDYLHAHFAEPIRLGTLAAICGTSPYHLVRTFGQVVGMPPHAYLTQIRANRARDLMVRGETLSGAAYLCGFSDQPHLTRTFKRIFGVTPGAYLAALQPSRVHQ